MHMDACGNTMQIKLALPDNAGARPSIEQLHKTIKHISVKHQGADLDQL